MAAVEAAAAGVGLPAEGPLTPAVGVEGGGGGLGAPFDAKLLLGASFVWGRGRDLANSASLWAMVGAGHTVSSSSGDVMPQ